MPGPSTRWIISLLSVPACWARYIHSFSHSVCQSKGQRFAFQRVGGTQIVREWKVMHDQAANRHVVHKLMNRPKYQRIRETKELTVGRSFISLYCSGLVCVQHEWSTGRHSKFLNSLSLYEYVAPSVRPFISLDAPCISFLLQLLGLARTRI